MGLPRSWGAAPGQSGWAETAYRLGGPAQPLPVSAPSARPVRRSVASAVGLFLLISAETHLGSAPGTAFAWIRSEREARRPRERARDSFAPGGTPKGKSRGASGRPVA